MMLEAIRMRGPRWVRLSGFLVTAVAWAVPVAAAPPSGLTVWTGEAPLAGPAMPVRGSGARLVATDRLPQPLSGNPVVATGGLVAACNRTTGELTLYSRDGNRLSRRCVVGADRPPSPVGFRLVSDSRRSGVGIEFLGPEGQLRFTVFFSPTELLRIQPGETQTVRVARAGLARAIVPSLIGTDLLYDPRQHPGRDRLYVPPMNMILGLGGAGDCMIVGVWPPGRQRVSLELAGTGSRRTIEGFTLALQGEDFFLRILEHEGIWHIEPLEPRFLERDTAIGWMRPFAARWIGLFYVDSEGIYYPFYFRDRRERVWGRFIRGWYYYPCWFDGDRTYIHFEKKFPPQGEMVIYHLESVPADQEVASPLGVMEAALGADLAARLLDREGIEHRPLLAHGDAVCAMTNKMEKFFEAGEEANQRLVIYRRADDVAEFIRMIRGRVFEYAAFASRMEGLLKRRRLADAGLTPSLEPLEAIVEEIGLAAREDLPDVPLAEVRMWTEEIKRLADQVRPTNRERYRQLARKCRQVAGSQDDLARDLSILTIRLMQEAASMGVESPEHAQLAGETIAACRQILRRPTWWEPRRHYRPKLDPGTP